MLRGVARDWPAVGAGSRSAADLTDYLARFGGGEVVDTLVGPPEIDGYFFYREDMAGLNFARSKQRLAAVLQDVQVSSKRGLLVRHAAVDTQGLRARSEDGKPLFLERGAQIAKRH